MDFTVLLVVLSQVTEIVTSEKCREDEFQCLNGECIPFDYKNDLIADCKDRSDLTSLPDCLRRHDIYGTTTEKWTLLKREIAKDGRNCSTKCHGNEGYGIMCDIDKTKEYCHVPFCGISTADYRIYCDFKASFCGWQIRSNATVSKWISEGKAVVKVSGKGTTRTTLVGPIADDSWRYHWAYSVNKSRNCIWTFTFSTRSPFHWRMDNCTECTSTFYLYNYKMTFALWITGNDYYELILKFAFKKSEDEMLWFHAGCDWDQVSCDGLCKDLSIFQDGFNDCGNGDEGTPYIFNKECSDFDQKDSYGYQVHKCSRSEIKCRGSGKCIPKIYPLSLRRQCLSLQKSFPYILTKTKCPAFYICKQKSSNKRAICLGQKEICDGIPQCPYWDDETSCSQVYCPHGCSNCSQNAYRCSSRALLDIPSNAVSIDVSGQNVKLRDVCFIRRLRLLSLNVSNCNLSEIRCITFIFPNLRYLDVSYNNLETPFIKAHSQLTLILDGNPIKILIFQCKEPIRHISLKNANVETFRAGVSGHLYMQFRSDSPKIGITFTALDMDSFDFGGNELESISFLESFVNLRSADVSKNKISYLKSAFNLRYLIRFIAHDNLLMRLSNLSFVHMTDLDLLDLSRNRIKSIRSNIFKTNLFLREVYLQNNLLKRLPSSLFNTLNSLQILRLDNNLIEYLPSETFNHQVELRTLNLKNNNIKMIPKRLFRHMPSLRFLDMSGNDIHVYEDMFYGLVLETLIVDQFSHCCAKPRSVTVDNCHAPRISISSCPFLIKSWPLGICFWYLTVILYSGNLFMIFNRLKNQDTSGGWNKSFLVNMSFADIMIGIYTFIIGLKDVGNKGQYAFTHDEWIRTWQCDALKLLSSLSLEATTILSVITSIWRLNPLFDCNRFKLNIVALVAWVLSIILAVAYFFWNKLTNHGVSMSPQMCIIVPIIYRLQDSHLDGSRYATWIFVWMLLHCSCSLLISSAEILNITWFRNSQRKRDAQLTVIVNAVAIRDMSICITGFVQMVDSIPDVFHELTLFIIPTCSVVGTLARFMMKSSNDVNFDVKEIILIRKSNRKPSGKPATLKAIIVLDPSLKAKIKSGIRSNDIVVVLSDQAGWKKTIRKIKILRHMIIGESPFPKPNVRIDVGKVTVQILNKSNETCIGQSSLKSGLVAELL